MADSSSIEWTHSTWNPVTGCTKVSAGCDHCYAERFSERFRGVTGHPFQSGFDLTLRPERIDQPKHWRRPRLIFVNSMSDLFHKEIPSKFVDRVFETMETANWHVYQVLTKRSSLMRTYVNRRYSEALAPSHIWLGVSIEDSSVLSRLRHLKQTRASIRFVSFEPLIGPIGLTDLSDIHWAIAGGESGPGARPVDIEWLRELRDQCLTQGVAFFLKQWGGAHSESRTQLARQPKVAPISKRRPARTPRPAPPCRRLSSRRAPPACDHGGRPMGARETGVFAEVPQGLYDDSEQTAVQGLFLHRRVRRTRIAQGTQDHRWSGCTVIADGVPTNLFSGLVRKSLALAPSRSSTTNSASTCPRPWTPRSPAWTYYH